MQVLFFDSECVLCNSVALKVADRNPAGNILFASLKGNYAKLIPESLKNSESLVFMDGDRFFIRSAAVFEILRYLPAWRWMRFFRVIPKRFADGLYDWVARNRVRWFGKQTVCMVPPAGLRARFLRD